jgi:hypothetical protein
MGWVMTDAVHRTPSIVAVIVPWFGRMPPGMLEPGDPFDGPGAVGVSDPHPAASTANTSPAITALKGGLPGSPRAGRPRSFS